MDPILITGAARSGTSLVAGIVDRSRADGGETCGPTNANPRGQYENNAIRNKITKPYLTSISADPMGQSPLPAIARVRHDALDMKSCKDFKRRVLGIMHNQDVNTKRPWYIKEAKSCLIWPLWDAAFPDAKWIIVRRDRDQIARSCVRTSFMRKFTEAEQWVEWVKFHERRFDEMREYYCNVREVWSERIIEGDVTEIAAAVDWASSELIWDQEAVADFVEPMLYKREGTMVNG